METLGVHLREMKTICPYKDFYLNVCNKLINSKQKLEYYSPIKINQILIYMKTKVHFRHTNGKHTATENCVLHKCVHIKILEKTVIATENSTSLECRVIE